MALSTGRSWFSPITLPSSIHPHYLSVSSLRTPIKFSFGFISRFPYRWRIRGSVPLGWHRELSTLCIPFSVDCFRNVMSHAQKKDFVFRRNGRVHLNRRGASVQSTVGSRGVRISGSNVGYTMFRGGVKSTGYQLHSPVSPFTSPPVRHHMPSLFNWSLRSYCHVY